MWLPLLLAGGPATAWERLAHEAVTRTALRALPPSSRAVLGPWEEELARRCMEPDDEAGTIPGERERHFLDLEAFGFPEPDLTKVPGPLTLTPDAARALLQQALDPGFPRDRARTGVLPEAARSQQRALSAALRAGDDAAARRHAVFLIHYVADAHQPLHATTRYNGIDAFQRGVHGAFEGDLVARCPGARPRYAAAVPAAEAEGAAVVLTALLEGHPLATTVLAADLGCPWTGKPPRPRCRAVPRARANAGVLACTHLEVIARERLERAAGRAARLLHAAWEEARAPAR
ncbi:MAG: hypothetical protein HY904_09805 [Deltaproteobacteria bacterium]|nr:hypothetical protein [Deltaproteobacteria bacterium]